MKYLLTIPILVLMVSSVLAASATGDFNLKAKGDSDYGYFRIISQMSVSHDTGKPMTIYYHGGKLNGKTVIKGTPSSGKGTLEVTVFNSIGDRVNLNLELKEKEVLSDDGNIVIINNVATGTLTSGVYPLNVVINDLRYEYNRNSKTIKVVSTGPFSFMIENLKVR